MKEQKRTFTYQGRKYAGELVTLGLLLLACLMIFRPYLFGDRILVFQDVGGDTLDLYLPQFASVIRHIREGNWSAWDMSYGMGANLLSLNLADPFFVLAVLLGLLLGTYRMLLYLVLLQILKVLLCGLVFYRFLGRFSYRQSTKAAAAFCYGLCGYLMVWGQHYSFGTVLIYYPLILLLVEDALHRRRRGRLLPAAVCLLGFYSVYFTYMTLAGTGLYVFFRLALGEEWEEGRIRCFCRICLLLLLGLGMALGLFLPTAFVILKVSSRVRGETPSLWELLSQCCKPFSLPYYQVFWGRLFSGNLFLPGNGKEKYGGLVNYYEDPALFSSAMTVFLDLQYLFLGLGHKLTKGKKVVTVILILVLAGLTQLQAGGILFNGLVPSTYRYTFLLLIPMLLAAATAWEWICQEHRLSLPALLAGLFLLVHACRMGLEASSLAWHQAQMWLLGATGAGLLLCLGLQALPEGAYRVRKAAAFLLAGILFVHMTGEARACYENRDTLTRDDSFFIQEQNGDIQEALAWLREEDPGVYRVEKDFSCGTYSMDAMLQGYQGISTYNSIMNGNLLAYLNLVYPEFFTGSVNRTSFQVKADDGWFAAFHGVRYLLSEDPALPYAEYEKIRQVGSIAIYKTTTEASLARFFPLAYSEESLKNLCTPQNRRLLLGRELAIPQEEGDPVKRLVSQEDLLSPGLPDCVPSLGLGLSNTEEVGVSLTLKAGENDASFYGLVSSPKGGYILVMIPYEEGWTCFVDGQETALVRGDLGFLAFQTPAGDHEFHLQFSPPGMKKGLLLGSLFWMLYLFSLWIIPARYRTRTAKPAAPIR